jgi:hypothetical protein
LVRWRRFLSELKASTAIRSPKPPQSVASFDMLVRIEHCYRFPSCYFRAKLEQ